MEISRAPWQPKPIVLPADPREDEEWFQNLPDDLRVELRAERVQSAQEWRALVARAKCGRYRIIAEAWCLVMVFQLIYNGFDPGALLWGALFGVALGVLWVLTSAGQLLSAVLAMVVFMVLQLVSNGPLGAFLFGTFGLGGIASFLGAGRVDQQVAAAPRWWGKMKRGP